MSDTPEIVPHRITKPIQLLAAWLAGLAIVNSSFLTAAGFLHEPTWLPTLLTIAAVINVPLFIASLFLLQTKFRPEMQEDTYYSKYLERKYSQNSLPAQSVDTEEHLSLLAESIVAKVTAGLPNKKEQVFQLLEESELSQMVKRFEMSRTLSELHFNRDQWAKIVERWQESSAFQEDIAALSVANVVAIPDGVVLNARLTPFGEKVARQLESENRLWHQLSKHARHEVLKPDKSRTNARSLRGDHGAGA